MTHQTGLNTAIINSNGQFKISKSHNVVYNPEYEYDEPYIFWNNWADWIKENSKDGDIVAVASYDIVSNAPSSGSAFDLLSSIGAVDAFNLEKNQPAHDKLRTA